MSNRRGTTFNAVEANLSRPPVELRRLQLYAYACRDLLQVLQIVFGKRRVGRRPVKTAQLRLADDGPKRPDA